MLLDPTACSSRDSGYVVVAGSVTHHLKLGANTVGRQRDNDIVVADEALLVSRRHCTIVIHASGQAELFDLASLNGTFLNGRKVEERFPLRSDDIVRLGRDLSFSVVLYNPIGN